MISYGAAFKEYCQKYDNIYDEFERFLLGIASLERLTDVIYKSFNKYIKERTYVMFQSIMDGL